MGCSSASASRLAHSLESPMSGLPFPLRLGVSTPLKFSSSTPPPTLTVSPPGLCATKTLYTPSPTIPCRSHPRIARVIRRGAIHEYFVLVHRAATYRDWDTSPGWISLSPLPPHSTPLFTPPPPAAPSTARRGPVRRPWMRRLSAVGRGCGLPRTLDDGVSAARAGRVEVRDICGGEDPRMYVAGQARRRAPHAWPSLNGGDSGLIHEPLSRTSGHRAPRQKLLPSVSDQGDSVHPRPAGTSTIPCGAL
ncbi:hypothetical protein DFH06DRAFT_253950 [Mycena polygramma]|nr:hypothetical protein DFH06DRAFT_253950 [Mycena polygramma]